MISREAPATLFGVPLALRRIDGDLLYQALRKAWAAQADCSVGDLKSDLDWMRPLFAATARELTLRRRLESLSLVDVDAPFFNETLGLRTGRGVLVTPDGRIMLEVLRSALSSDGDTVVIGPTVLSWAIDQAYRFYRPTALTRLERVLALRAGEDEPLRYPSVGFVLFLLVNRSVDERRALRRPEREADRAALDAAIERPVTEFADVFHTGRTRRAEHFSLYGGYVITEARRRIGEHLSPDPAVVYILPGHDQATLQFLAQDLKRRGTIRRERLQMAFDALVGGYRESQPALAALGLSFERPSVTAELGADLLAAFDRAQPR